MLSTYHFFVLGLLCIQMLTTTSENVKQRGYFPEERMNVSSIIRYYGYPCEVHEVITADGYVLIMQRILPGLKHNFKGQTVFLQHGLLDSAATWIMNTPDKSLAFILADAGYDVWLGNSRGNTYSKKHLKYTTKDKQFWEFSFDEMAKYDLPASIYYVLNVTGAQQIYYVGHSQGTTIGFIEFGRNVNLARRIKTFFSLAPVTTVGHIKGALKVLSPIEPEIQYMIQLLGIKEFLPSSAVTKFLGEAVCGAGRIMEETCGNILFLMCGFDTKNLNKTRVPLYLSLYPAGTSVRDVIHFAQMVRTGKFQMYDYGEVGNIQHYHQPVVPKYNVSSVNTPVVMFSGSHDWLADPYDVNNNLKQQLPYLVYSQDLPGWNHLDFVWGMRAHEMIYSKIVKMMNDAV
ncbi:gastric triacylglycerol lipase-like isoform X2 [Hydractinia symbiolongicarpus]|nr:gastric triacylglycerol lipase-like isoform X2 [Hydractinia symbiolongicarpus]